jgi:hypothetical protein
MKLRDQLKKDKKFDEYKKQRNVVSAKVKAAKEAYITKIVGDNYDTAHIWRAINTITHKSTRSNSLDNIVASPDDFNDHFVSVSSLTNSTSKQAHHEYSNLLLAQFCKDHILPGDSFRIPEIAVHEVGGYISSLKD